MEIKDQNETGKFLEWFERAKATEGLLDIKFCVVQSGGNVTQEEFFAEVNLVLKAIAEGNTRDDPEVF